ncbi:MAG: hypothetical protein ABWK01_00760 [Infirmifilum sp.]
MRCEEAYHSLEAFADNVYESRDFFGLPVKAFEFGSREHPPLLLVGDLYGCSRAAEVIVDTMLRYTGDAHIVAVPCPFPSVSEGLSKLSRILVGVECQEPEKFRELLSHEISPLFENNKVSVFTAGNIILVFLQGGDTPQIVELHNSFKDRMVLFVREDGSVEVFQMPSKEALTASLESFLKETPTPLLAVNVRCWNQGGSCFFLPEKYFPEISELAALASAQLEEAHLCHEPIPGAEQISRGVLKVPSVMLSEVLSGDFPSLELTIGSKSYLEASRSILAVLNAAYLLRALLS